MFEKFYWLLCLSTLYKRAARSYSSRKESEGPILARSGSRCVSLTWKCSSKSLSRQVWEWEDWAASSCCSLLATGEEIKIWNTLNRRVSVQKQLKERTGASLAATQVETYQARGNPPGVMKAKPVKPVTFSFERKSRGSAGVEHWNNKEPEGKS